MVLYLAAVSNSEHTYYRSIRELGLAEGATPEEIRKAFRNLSKKYHPDVYALDAGERFKIINSAYLYLKKHPEPPQAVYHSRVNQTVYQEDYKEEYRRRYWAKKQKEVELKQQMLQWVFTRVRVIIFAIVLLNILLAVDYLLPKQTMEKELLSTQSFSKSYNARGGRIRESYTLLHFNEGYEIKIKHDHSRMFEKGENFMISLTSITKEVLKVESLDHPGQIYSQRYGVFSVFGFIIPMVLILSFLYFYVIKNNDYKLTLIILLFICGLAQLVLLI